MGAKIEPINEAERNWIEAQRASASKFVEGFCRSGDGQPLTLRALDGAFAEWLASAPSDVSLINAVINYVGIAFGQALVDGLDLRWVVATDEFGSELAVHGLPGTADILVYPANFVAKRWERGEANFLEASYGKIAHDIAVVSKQWQRSGSSE